MDPAVAEGGQPVQLQREEHNEHQCHPELGQRDAENGHKDARAVDHAVLVRRRRDAERDADDDLEQHAAHREHQRLGEAQRDLRPDGGAGDVGLAEIKVQKRLLQEAQELNDERIAETELHALGLKHLLRHVRSAENGARRVAGDEIHDREDHERHAEQHRDQEQDALDDVF